MTIWIVGTSVSIQHGGYVTRLNDRLRGMPGVDSCRNLSVGDQNSLMGCMRVLAHQSEFRADDLVIWEYSLLDTILDDNMFPAVDVQAARRLAWSVLCEHGVRIVVLLVPPRRGVDAHSEQEQAALADAAALRLDVLDVREIFKELNLAGESQYADDRHLQLDSPVLDSLAESLLVLIRKPRSASRSFFRSQSALPLPSWRWAGPRELASGDSQQHTRYTNSLMDVPALALPVDSRITLPANERIVAVGIVSTHASGGLWCGHPGCAPAATRLPSELRHDFLLRASPVPCVRAGIEGLVAAPDWSYGRGVWAAYGQELCEQSGPVVVFGVLYEPTPADAEGGARRPDNRRSQWRYRLRGSRDGLLARAWRKLMRRLE